MLLMFSPVSLLAKGSEATITRLYGKVQLLVNPTKRKRDHHHMPSTKGNTAMYEKLKRP